jgi:hypothetical protein
MANKRARISDRNPLTATDSVISGYEQVNKLASQKPKLKEQQDESVTSEQVEKSGSQQVDQPTSEQVSKLTSHEVVIDLIAIPDQATTEEVSKSASQLVDISKSGSQQADNLTSQLVDFINKSTSQQPDQSTSQPASKPVIRKATFQVDAAILADLDRYHLQLQIEMGRRNAPYKEILVEEAIAQWLERAAKSPDRAMKSLIKRQQQR